MNYSHIERWQTPQIKFWEFLNHHYPINLNTYPTDDIRFITDDFRKNYESYCGMYQYGDSSQLRYILYCPIPCWKFRTLYICDVNWTWHLTPLKILWSFTEMQMYANKLLTTASLEHNTTHEDQYFPWRWDFINFWDSEICTM